MSGNMCESNTEKGEGSVKETWNLHTLLCILIVVWLYGTVYTLGTEIH